MKKKKPSPVEMPPIVNKELAAPLQITPPQVAPQEGFYTRIKHSVNLGDIIATLPAVKRYYEVTKRKVIFYQTIGQLAQYYPGATHPTVNSEGQNVCVNDIMFDMIKPLVESQEYIYKMEKYTGQHIDLNFDVIRSQTFAGLPNLMIQSWIMYAFPDLAIDLSKPWMTLPDIEDHPIKKQVKGKIILNFTERYRSEPTDYYFLKRFAPELVFGGTEREHFMFCNRWQLDIPRLQITDFLEYAYAIKYSRFFFGNQSLGWNIAQAIQHPRIVELCRFAPNVQPFVGDNSFGFFHQTGAEYYLRRLYNETR